MKWFKIIINILAFVVGIGLVIVGQNGDLLALFNVPVHSIANLVLEFVGIAIILVQLFFYNKSYTRYDVKPTKKSKAKK